MAAYFAIKSYCQYTTNLFFREVSVINEENVPEEGPTIVYSNHNNQFVDGLLLTANIKRKISFVAAAKSMRRNIIGPMLHASEAIPVQRPQDVAVKGAGVIKRVQGNKVYGEGTQFTKLRPKSTLAIKKQQLFVKQIVDDSLIITGTEDYEPIQQNSPYKVVPKLQYHELYHHVWEALHKNRCIGIFPEGGSHDRLQLLPFKAGICIMALGAMEKYGCPVTIVPAGFNYYNPQNFRSKVILEFGTGYRIPQQMVELYKTDKKKAISTLLQLLETMLKSVTTSGRTFDELSTLLLCRELYSVKSKKQLSVKQKLQLNRRFAKGFDILVKEPNFRESYKKLQEFNNFVRLNGLSVKKTQRYSLLSDLLRFFLYFEKCIVRATIALPGIILMGPTTSIIAYKAEKQRIRCLKSSNVKLKGNDVVGSYKILLSMIYFPITTSLHTVIFYKCLKKFTQFDTKKCLKISLLIPLLMPLYAFFLVKSYDSFGRSFTKLKLLFLRLFRRSIYSEFNAKKKELTQKIIELVDKYGGDVVEDFEANRIVKAQEIAQSSQFMVEGKGKELRQ